MKSSSRVHLYTHRAPNGRAYIVGERRGLTVLIKAIDKAINGAVGLETITLYTSDGHPYELMIVTDVTEQEWQETIPPYDKKANPAEFESVKVYDELKESLE